MNVIGIMLDSLRADHVGCYGNDWIETPNIDALAKESALFLNAYPEGLPTIPVRTELFTGRCTLHSRPWQPLTVEDVSIAEILRAYGYRTALIADTYHLFKPGMNFHRGFDVFRWIRGQEADSYRSGPADRNYEDFSKDAMKGTHTERMLHQYLKNTSGRTGPDDHFPAQVMNTAIEWLEGSHDQGPFFLWVDSFDPHEPWDPPPPFDTKYTDPNYKGKKLIHPKYGPVDWMTEEELANVRALYAGEVSFVDQCVGKLIDKVKELGRDKDTLIVLIADHGHPHGDHGIVMKHATHLHSELLRIPLLIRHPEGLHAGECCTPLVQTQDIPATILDMIGVEHSVPMDGESIWPLVTGERDKLRDYALIGFHESPYRCVRDLRWSFVLHPKGEKDELYDLENDPKEKNNLVDEHPDVARRMLAQIGRYGGTSHQKGGGVNLIQLKYETAYTTAE